MSPLCQETRVSREAGLIFSSLAIMSTQKIDSQLNILRLFSNCSSIQNVEMQSYHMLLQKKHGYMFPYIYLYMCYGYISIYVPIQAYGYHIYLRAFRVVFDSKCRNTILQHIISEETWIYVSVCMSYGLNEKLYTVSFLIYRVNNTYHSLPSNFDFKSFISEINNTDFALTETRSTNCIHTFSIILGNYIHLLFLLQMLPSIERIRD